MFTSYYLWQKYVTPYFKKREYFNGQSPSTISNTTAITILIIILVIALIHFIAFVVAMILAFKCGNKQGKSLALNVLGAFFFPEIYILYYFFTKCKVEPQQVVITNSPTSQGL